MKKNFAGQPAGGGNITILTGQDLMLDVNPAPPIFQKRPLFVDNCKNCNMENFANADGEYGIFKNGDGDKGGFWSGINFGTVLDTAKTGVGIWAQQQQNRSAAEQAQYALEIERQRLAQERAKAEAEAAKAEAESSKAGSVAGKIKAYALPITITGVLVIGGIAAYFYFKKKKVS
jgi:hypothetical protein